MIKNVYESEQDLEEEREDLKTETIESKLKKLEIGGDSGTCIKLKNYENEKDMPEIMQLITKDLSEPYSIYTYRYFIHNWPNLCFLVSISFLKIPCKFDNFHTLEFSRLLMKINV